MRPTPPPPASGPAAVRHCSCRFHVLRHAAFVVADAVAEHAELRAVAVGRRFAVGEESLPDDAIGVGDPALLALGVAAGGPAFLEHGAVGSLETAIDLAKLTHAFRLDAEVAHAVDGFGAG